MAKKLDFLKNQWPLLAFGLSLTFFSSFGQTFLISLYVPSISEDFNLTNTNFGLLYAIATSSSALVLPFLGGKFDNTPLKKYTFLVLGGLVIALLSLLASFHVLVVFLGVWWLRLFGQGLMSHTSVSSMAAFFKENRGKAIGIATLGHPIGEASLPILITLSIGAFGWRTSLGISALSILIIVTPLVYFLLNKAGKKPKEHEVDKAQAKPQISYKAVLFSKKFLIIAPAVFILGFTNTALFFFQLKLGEARGWSNEWVSISLSAFALASASGMFGAGPLVDRLSARKLFPFFLFPYLIGLALLISIESAWIYPTSLLFMGLANGSGSTIKNALFAEIFGSSQIGRVRSLFTTIMVFSTALGPISFGLFLDKGIGFEDIFLFNAIFMGIVALISFTIYGIQREE